MIDVSVIKIHILLVYSQLWTTYISLKSKTTNKFDYQYNNVKDILLSRRTQLTTMMRYVHLFGCAIRKTQPTVLGSSTSLKAYF